MKSSQYDDVIDRLRSEVDIVGIISEYVPLKKKGKNFWGCCPFHAEKTPSFSVAPEKGFFYCFGCQAGGDIFQFLMKAENIGFLDAVKILANKLNIPLPEKEKSPQEAEHDREMARLYRVNELAAEFFHTVLLRTRYGEPARRYLEKREIPLEWIKKFKLGFAPPAWDKLSHALHGKGFTDDLLCEAGLAAPRQSGNSVYDRFRGRIMFPILDVRGRTLGFGGRVLDDSQPKYLNTPETPVFNKRRVLYGIQLAYHDIKQAGQAIVVEGYMDAIAAHAAGVHNTVASLGTAFTVEQAKILSRYAPKMIFAFDSDAAGQHATMRALDTVRASGASVRVLSIPDGKDPDEFIRKQGAERFRELAANASTLLGYQVGQVLKESEGSGPEDKVAVVAKAVPFLAEADNAVAVNVQIAHLAQVLAVDESSIRSELRMYLSRLRKGKKDNNVNHGQTISGIRLINRPATAPFTAEQHIIRLMCEDYALIPFVKLQLATDELMDSRHQEIVSRLFDLYDSGQSVSPDRLLGQLGSEAGAELSRIMLLDLDVPDMAKLVDDCLKTLRLTRLKQQYQEHCKRADELQRVGDSRYQEELAESQRIQDEIKKLHFYVE